MRASKTLAHTDRLSRKHIEGNRFVPRYQKRIKP